MNKIADNIKKDQENLIDKVKNTHYNVFKFLTKMQWQGGVHDLPMRREETDGVSLRDGILEVALEQWTERRKEQSVPQEKDGQRKQKMRWSVSVGSNVFPALQGSGIG